MGMFYKRRDYSTIINGKNPIVAHEFLGDDVAGKDVIIVDDMIASEKYVMCQTVKKKKKRAVYLYVQLLVYSPKGFENLTNTMKRDISIKLLRQALHICLQNYTKNHIS